MLNLTEYARKPKLLSDYLPWGFLVGPGIVLNKDGSFMRLARYRGPDLESAIEAELIAVTARINNVLKRFGSGWALFFEATRKEALSYPLSDFPDPVSLLVDEERRKGFESEAGHFESTYTLALCWLSPAETQDKAGSYLVERGDDERGASDSRGFEWCDSFVAETERALDLLATILPEVHFLSDEETLTHLHRRVSTKDHVVSAPAIPAYLDALLADTSFTGGIAPKLGDQHLRTLTVLGLPGTTTPGLLDALNDLAIGYTWVTRWIALDRSEAQTLLTRKRRQWFAKRKSVAAILREVLFNLDSRVAVLDDGRFVVSWTTEHPTDGDGRAVLASIFNADGTPSAGQFLVNTTAGESQLESSIAVLADGRIVMSWRDDSNTAGDTSFAAIRARIVNPDGSPSVPEFLVNTSILNSQDESQLVALADGRFMVTWTDDSLADNALLGSDIRARIFNPDGSQSVGEFVINSTTGSHQFDSSIAQLADGRIVVSWTDASFTVGDTSGFAVRARIFNSNGTQAVSEFVVTTTTLSNQFESSIAALADGRFVVSWTDGTGDGSGDAIKARIFNANGTESVPEFLVNSTTVRAQLDSQIAVLADGRLIAVWTDFSATGDDSNLGAIRARIFNADGTEAVPEFVVNTITTSQQTESSIAVMQDGRFVVTWTDLSQTGGDLFGKAIRSQVFDPTVFDGTSAEDVITGGSLRDVYSGNDGDDSLFGGGGDDELKGGAGKDNLKGDSGNDLLTGEAGNDTLTGNAGADLMEGGSGNDSYFTDGKDTIIEAFGSGNDIVRSTASITLGDNLERLTLIGTLNRNGTGNELANTIVGNDGINTLDGGAGKDNLTGGIGRDTLIGGSESDRFKFTLGDSGQTAGTMDKISDFEKGAVNVGDRFDFSSILAVGGSVSAATASEASIDQTTGIATFAAGSGNSMTDALSDIANRFTLSGDSAGEFALFQVGGSGAFHIFVSDGVAGVTANDVLVQLTNLTSIGAVNLTGGDLTILS